MAQCPVFLLRIHGDRAGSGTMDRRSPSEAARGCENSSPGGLGTALMTLMKGVFPPFGIVSGRLQRGFSRRCACLERGLPCLARRPSPRSRGRKAAGLGCLVSAAGGRVRTGEGEGGTLFFLRVAEGAPFFRVAAQLFLADAMLARSLARRPKSTSGAHVGAGIGGPSPLLARGIVPPPCRSTGPSDPPLLNHRC
jgi:hypothetical protein